MEEAEKIRSENSSSSISNSSVKQDKYDILSCGIPMKRLSNRSNVMKKYSQMKNMGHEKLKKSSHRLSEKKNHSKASYISTEENKKRRLYEKPPEMSDHLALIQRLRESDHYTFVYLKYAVPQTSPYFDLYCYKEVPFGETDGITYATASPKGVTQIFPNESKFTPLDEWEQNYNLFKKIRKLKAFENFRVWKAFAIWKSGLNWRKFKARQAFLEMSLFILDGNLGSTILTLYKKFLILSEDSFIDLKNAENLPFFYFLEDQMVKYEYMKDELNTLRQYSLHLMESTMKAFLLGHGFLPDDSNFDRPPPVGTRKSILGNYMTYRQRADKRNYCARLTCFLSYMDNHVIALLRTVLYQSFEKLVRSFESHSRMLPSLDVLQGDKMDAIIDVKRSENSPKAPMFVLALDMTSAGIGLDPSEDTVFEQLDDLFLLWENCVFSYERYVSDKLFDSFTNPTILGKKVDPACRNPADIKKMLENEVHYRNIRVKFYEELSNNFDKVKLYIKRFDKLRIMYAEDLMLNMEDIRIERDLNVHRRWLERFAQELKFLNHIPDRQHLGLFLLKQSQLKKIMLPVTMNLMNELSYVLPKLARQKVGDMFRVGEDITTQLSREPQTTKEFVEYLDYLHKSVEVCDKLNDVLEYTKEIYNLLDEFSVYVDEDDRTRLAKILINLDAVGNLVNNKLKAMPELTKRFSVRIQMDVALMYERAEEIREEALQSWLIATNTQPAIAKSTILGLQERMSELHAEAADFQSYQKSFNVELTQHGILDEIQYEVRLRQMLWESLDIWTNLLQQWYTCDFSILDVELMDQKISEMHRNATMLHNGLPENEMVPVFKEEVELYKDRLPVVQYLRNKNLKLRHWLRIEAVIGRKFDADSTLTLQILAEANCFNHTQEFSVISSDASSEAALETLLNEVESAWKERQLEVISYKNRRDTFVLTRVDEIQILLDESCMKINMIASSRHVVPIQSRVQDWIGLLNIFAKTLYEWCACQQTWMQLEPILTVPDIQRQLPKEVKMFTIVNNSWKKIMSKTEKAPLALPAMTTEVNLQTLKRDNALLDQILRCLEAYLEVKRIAFPRFYFLSNNELLDILALTKNPMESQSHLSKCFDAIARLEYVPAQRIENGKEGDMFTNDLTSDISAIWSPEGERINFQKVLKIRGGVEDWLRNVEKCMFSTLKNCMKIALADYEAKNRNEWLRLHPNQIVLTITQIIWTRNIHSILESPENRLRKLKDFESTSLSSLSSLASIVITDISNLLHKVVSSLITLEMHSKDVLASLISNEVDNIEDFEWIKTLRYYWVNTSETVEARMTEARIQYGYEYLGANSVLVQTPLTDRCYLCLIRALRMDLGGSLMGPASSGKTETVKNLAKSVAVQCLVFNCSLELDYKTMGRFLCGSAQSGSWCCFDDFNRIQEEVLSVIAQQLVIIRNAKILGANRFMFDGREMNLVRSCATFTTMNPGFPGRSELPDNLKSLFRPMQMMVPDFALITEVILYSEGFENSRMLANKIVRLQKMCSTQLSIRDHYDFGMRAIKNILFMAGVEKRTRPIQDEESILILVILKNQLPKFLPEDAKVFRWILNDLFPSIELPVLESHYTALRRAAVESLEEKGLQTEECILTKIIQLHEVMLVFCGVMLVGPTGGGKTTIINNLADALGKLYNCEEKESYCKPVKKFTINPGTLTFAELYGAYDSDRLKWNDGLLGLAFRAACTNQDEIQQWIINDGPVDPIWMENLNTVLDENKILCLSNSERIKLTPWVHVLFEVTDLSQASPATVSRCGVVFVIPEDLGWLPYIISWTKKISADAIHPDQIDLIIKLSSDHLIKILDFANIKCSHMIHQVDISKIATFCSLMHTLLLGRNSSTLLLNANADEKLRTKIFVIECFIWSALWSIGGNLTTTSRETFNVFITELFASYSEIEINKVENLWDVYMDSNSKTLRNLNELVPKFAYDPLVPFHDIAVPTFDATRINLVASMLLESKRPVMFVGDRAVGKTIIARNIINYLTEHSNAASLFANFSANTTSARAQQLLEYRMEKRSRTVIGAPFGKYLIAFIDDVNLPLSGPSIELLRQLVDFGGFYDRKRMFWKTVQEVVLSCACHPHGGHILNQRFVRHFSILVVPPPPESTLKVIYQSILKGFFADFSATIQELAEPLVAAVISLYQRVAKEFRPTPMKSHYIFNMRDISKTIQGIMQANSLTVREPMQMYRLFFHECSRVFHDKLINADDKFIMNSILQEVSLKHFGCDVIPLGDLLLFGDFMKIECSKENRLYEEIVNFEKLNTVLESFIEDYNMKTGNATQIILFKESIEHILRLVRILRTERGNGMLIGLSGLGKQSLAKLAAHINGYKCAQIEITKDYGHSSFREDLRNLYYNTGIAKEPTVFLFTEDQIIIEEFLDVIDNILNSGEVPNLFYGDEYEKVMIDFLAVTEASDSMPVHPDTFDAFITNVRKNLHVMISVSCVGDSFRRRCRTYPSLVNCCTIDYFMKWPREALLSIAQNSFTEIGDEELVTKLAEICEFIHKCAEDYSERFYEDSRIRYYVTPKSFLELIELYQDLLKKRTSLIENKRDKLMTGLRKIKETNEVVAQMKKELQILAPQRDEKSNILQELKDNLSIEQKESDKVRGIVNKEEALAKEKAAETTILAGDAQRDLEAALPALEAAQTALNALNKTDIIEMRAQKPPPLVQFVMEAVCVLLGEKSDWATAKQILGDPRFLDRLENFDKNHIKEKTLIALKDYVNHKDFIPDTIIKVSKVAKSLCIWVKAIEIYAKVYKSVEPKQKKVEASEKELSETMILLKEKQRQLTEIEARIEGLQEQVDSNVIAQKELEDNVELCAARLSRADRLTSALADDEIRWAEGVETLSKELATLPGDILLAAGFLAYLGVFNSKYRKELIHMWTNQRLNLEIPSSQEFELSSILGDSYELRIWNFHGLPRDVISYDNAIIMRHARRWPLIIDPQEQASQWIRNMEKDNNIRVLKMTDQNLQIAIESAIRVGTPVLIDQIEEFLEPTLDPILYKKIILQDERQFIRLGDSEMDYNDSFKLYMTTKLPQPQYSPKVCIQVTLVNFNITSQGLENQLLMDIASIEIPELECRATELVAKINEDEKQLNILENRVLTLIFESDRCLLDDEELVDTLNESKEDFDTISARLIETKTNETKIMMEREQYRALATRGSILYFVIAQLATIDYMYQFSLKYFKKIFTSVLETSVTPQSTDIENRLGYLMDAEILAIYVNVSRSLFEKDKLLFSFLLSVAIEKELGNISDLQWDFFLHSATIQINEKLGPAPEGITDTVWQSANYLHDTFTAFHGLVEDVVNDKKINLGDFTKTISIPGASRAESKIDWSNRLGSFDKLLLFRVFQEKDLVSAISAFIRITLGKEFTENPPSSLHDLFPEINSSTPLIFILSPGCDPLPSLQRFAEEKGFSGRLEIVSLGQDQGAAAQIMIDRGRQDGCWVYLQNWQLARSWVSNVDTIVNDRSIASNADFRLFLSTMPTTSIPISILQNSVKVVHESPKSLRSNVIQALDNMDPDYFEDNPMGQNWRAMVFGLVLFHSVIQCRKKFGPLGWNMVYDFNESDRDISCMDLYNLCMNASVPGIIPWNSLEYITGWITYGGHIADSWDQRCLQTILKNFFSFESLIQNYKYSQSGVYYCPEYQTLTEYREFVRQFPYVDMPELFGIHENAGITNQTEETKSLLLSLRGKSISQEGITESSNLFVYRKAEEIMSQIPKTICQKEPYKLLTQKDSKDMEHPLTIVLMQEVDRYNKLLLVFHKTLDNIQNAIKGYIVMSEDLEDVHSSIFNNVVPRILRSEGYDSLKSLASWAFDLQLRLNFIENWYDFGKPISFWLPGFFSPQAFLAGVLQTYARENNVPVDQLEFDFKVLPNIIDQEQVYRGGKTGMNNTPLRQIKDNTETSEKNILIHGLFLDAARWDMINMILGEQFHGEMNSPMPVIQLIPTISVQKSNRYETPLYRTSIRTGDLSTIGQCSNFVISVLLPSSKPTCFWILQGTALNMQIAN